MATPANPTVLTAIVTIVDESQCPHGQAEFEAIVAAFIEDRFDLAYSVVGVTHKGAAA